MAAAAAAATTVSALAISCLLLVSGISVDSEGQLQVLSEVVSGPARGRPLVLHLDATLPADVRRAAVDVEAVRRTPHLTLTLSLGHSRHQEALTGGGSSSFSSYSSAVLHVALWLTPQPELLQVLWLHWKPRNLLLFSLGSSPGTDLLRHEALSGVEKVALIGHLPAQVDPRPDVLGVYTVLPFSSGGVRLLGPWRREAFVSWEALFPDRFPSFEGYTFHLATWMIDFPYLYQTNATPAQGTGITITALNSLSAPLNFTYTLTVKPPQPVYGGKLNGSWAGLLGMVHRREKNFSANTFHLTPERVNDFDPSSYLGFANIGAFLLTPQPLPMWINLLRPFTSGVWATVGVSFVVAVCSFHLLVQTSRLCGLVGHWRASVWLELHRALVCQSAPVLPRALWQRVFLAVWLSCCLVVTAAYTCNLVGIFTRPAYPQRLVSLHQLADSRFRLAKHDVGGITAALIRQPPNALYAKGDLFPRQKDVVAALLAGTHALVELTYVGRLMLASHHEAVSWYAVKEPLLSGSVHCFFRKHTPWKHKFDVGFQRLVEAGLFRHWYKDEMAKLRDGGSAEDDSGAVLGPAGDGVAPPLTLWHLQGVFYILGLSWVAGGAVLLLELLTHRQAQPQGSERPLE